MRVRLHQVLHCRLRVIRYKPLRGTNSLRIGSARAVEEGDVTASRCWVSSVDGAIGSGRPLFLIPACGNVVQRASYCTGI
jgi:hypothetical protein